MSSTNDSGRPRTFISNLHPWAEDFNLRPHLRDVTLANILAGDTCTPIGLEEFEKYLTSAEYSVENLQFIVWFQDYRERFSQAARKQFTGGNDTKNEPNFCPATPTSTLSFSPLLKNHEPSHVESGFDIECSRAIATFFSPGASKELTLDETLRDTVIRRASESAHPDAFLPAYEEVYRMVELFSVPRFLSIASTNINLSKQYFWYIVGVAFIVMGLVLAVLLIVLLPTPPQHNRGYRMFAALMMSYGSADIYSGWRGFCSQVWMRGNVQLRSWELQELDEEAKTHVHRVCLSSESQVPSQRNATDLPPTESKTSFGPSIPDSIGKISNLASIAPFAQEPPTPVTPDLRDIREEIPLRALLPADENRKQRLQLNRPPIFGPETVVKDPRIKAVHRQVMYEVTRWGVCSLVIFAAVMMSVPGRAHR